jgi:hypothetical protein
MKKSNRTSLTYYKKKLERLLNCSPDADFLKLCWAMDAHQSGRKMQANRFIRIPDELNEFNILPWTIETLVNELLTIPKSVTIAQRYRNCHDYRAFAAAYNALSSLENAQTGELLENVDVLEELRRLSQRQFEWQTGYTTYPRLYRSAYLYGGEHAKAHFLSSYGLSVDQFSLVCFGLYAMFRDHADVKRQLDWSSLGVEPQVIEAAVLRMACSHQMARDEAKMLRLQGGEVAYQKSVLRKFPCIIFDGTLQAPLPELIVWRSTSGLFYDFVAGPEQVRNEISKRFETYCHDLMRDSFPALTVSPSLKYKVGKLQLDTPDILISKAGVLSVILECKATRMSHDDRYSISPIGIEKRRYDEISKGVFQIWRMVSHLRRGLISPTEQSPDLTGVVLTLDNWLVSANSLTKTVLSRARDLVLTKDPQIIDADCIPVIVCPIDYFEATIQIATSESLLSSIYEAASPKYDGWMLWNVHQDLFPYQNQNNPYPYKDSGEHGLPWLMTLTPSPGRKPA